jgi:FkbM family methyltransferase
MTFPFIAPLLSSVLLLSSFPFFSAKSPITVQYPSSIFTHPWDWRETTPTFSSKLTKDTKYLEIGKAQDREDLWIYENWFYGMTNGTILESGALNGIQYSTSSMFEKFASWLAIHVEADPKNYHELRQYRPNSINIHAALCKEAKLLHFTNTPNNAINGFVEFMNPSFIATWHPQLHANPELINALPSILCVPLPHLLTELGVHKIDVWVLDVEGAELSVLESMDFKKVKVSTIAMECDRGSAEVDQAKQDILKKNGFQCQQVGHTFIIRPVDFSSSLSPLQIERNCFCQHESFTPSKIPPHQAQWKSLRIKDGIKFD